MANPIIPGDLLPIDLNKSWAEVFGVIEENYRRIYAQVINQQSALRVNQFEGDKITNDFVLDEDISSGSSVMLFRNDQLYAQGLSSAVHTITGRVVHIATPLEEDEGLSVFWVQSNYITMTSDYFLQQLALIKEQLDASCAASQTTIRSMQDLEHHIDTKAATLGQTIGTVTPIPGGYDTIGQQLAYLYSEIHGSGVLTDAERAALARIVDCDIADSATVTTVMRNIFDNYTQETIEQMQQKIELCADYVERAEEAAEQAELAPATGGSIVQVSNGMLQLKRSDSVLLSTTSIVPYVDGLTAGYRTVDETVTAEPTIPIGAIVRVVVRGVIDNSGYLEIDMSSLTDIDHSLLQGVYVSNPEGGGGAISEKGVPAGNTPDKYFNEAVYSGSTWLKVRQGSEATLSQPVFEPIENVALYLWYLHEHPTP